MCITLSPGLWQPWQCCGQSYEASSTLHTPVVVHVWKARVRHPFSAAPQIKVVGHCENVPLAAWVWGWCWFVHFAFSHFKFPNVLHFSYLLPISYCSPYFSFVAFGEVFLVVKKNVTSCSRWGGHWSSFSTRDERVAQIPWRQLAWFAFGAPYRFP